MNSRFVRGAVMLLSLWLGMLPLYPGIAADSTQANKTIDVLKVLGFPVLFEGSKLPDISESREGSLERTSGWYSDVSLPDVFTLARKLEEDRWYFTGDQALKGRSALMARYDLKMRRLYLELTADHDKAVWPEVLTPRLACTTPVFAGGAFVSSGPLEIPDRVDSVRLVYEGVKPEDVQAYAALLGQSGYESRQMEGGGEEYVKSLRFVRLAYLAQAEKLAITVGEFLVFYAPLPPWPDPLPEQLKRLMPPVAARQTVDMIHSGYLAEVTDISLYSLYRFVHSAGQRYGWSVMGDDAVLSHSESGLRLEVLAWDTSTHRLLFLLEGDIAALFPAPGP